MFRFPRALSTATVAAALLVASAAPGEAQVDLERADVPDLDLPVSDLVLETSSLDGTYRRFESTEDVRLTLDADVLFGASLGGEAPAFEASGEGERDPGAANTTADGERIPKG